MLSDLIGSVLGQLPAATITGELLANAALVCKLNGVPCYAFFEAAAIVWGDGTTAGTPAVWATFEEQRKQAEQARAERAKTAN